VAGSLPSSGDATTANPAKAGDAKLRGYRTPHVERATPVEPPIDALREDL
jgi:hypothetical protein